MAAVCNCPQDRDCGCLMAVTKVGRFCRRIELRAENTGQDRCWGREAGVSVVTGGRVQPEPNALFRAFAAQSIKPGAAGLGSWKQLSCQEIV